MSKLDLTTTGFAICQHRKTTNLSFIMTLSSAVSLTFYIPETSLQKRLTRKQMPPHMFIYKTGKVKSKLEKRYGVKVFRSNLKCRATK